MKRRPLPIIALALLAWIGCSGFVCAGEPTLVLQWNIANSGQSIGSVGWGIEKTGWPGFIREQVKPAVDWCKASGVKPVVLIHHPWGQYEDPMHLDGLDYAKAAGATWLTNRFSSNDGWRSISGSVPCYGYVGGVELSDRLRRLPPAELGETIRRNLKPMADAGFRGVYVDFAENAIAHPFSFNQHYGFGTGPHPQDVPRRSLDQLTLAIADSMFPEKTGIEAAPRSFKAFASLWTRNIVLEDWQWQHRYGPRRHGSWNELGYHRDVLKGSIWRTLNYSIDVEQVVDDARAIAAEGHTPVVYAAPLIGKVRASALFDADVKGAK